jgi:hypothetical protein
MKNALCCALLLASSVGAVDDTLYGVCAGDETGAAESNIESIDANTARRTPLGSGLDNVLLAQQLSAIDAANGVLYSVVFNMTTKKPVVVGWSTVDGTVTVEIPLPFEESAFVGVGQHIGVDPVTGKVVVSGQDTAVQGHHVVLVDPANPTAPPVSIAKVKAPAIGLLGGDCTFDTDLGVFYFAAPLSPQGAGPEELKRAAASWSRPPTIVDRTFRTTSFSPSSRPTTQPPPPPPPPFEIDWVVVRASFFASFFRSKLSLTSPPLPLRSRRAKSKNLGTRSSVSTHRLESTSTRWTT